ncbi:MAG: hypothetical protein A2430_00875 [Candidatus Liptonbacteria bacterium RIFOXYC1_FULL_36_8]|uniref:Small ribosomal subunit protein bS6 n=3 Tax=Candidatus Liptoniibacteriota TaxID=1817909 RepID=A0A1G2CPP4_9BACT|nr:MAG: hypothetical protein A2390_03195 [Candidatus Liptonbacteria bacterium RIFOXYB1_FULL_36_10]OGZ03856.1 MAG: hypothetical protein A2430_00875 [Candidatus Liptonbacteria bacterium RIFOXYC1_FULL_36_8]OGZ04290.1 MAG: hypothetical protein A2604_00765 [Candidatus Liptonbacteria bacterium RIFOXYD1_FULL_36_11]
MDINDKKKYEIGFLFENEQDVAEILSALEKNGAERLNEIPVKKISLSYPIKKRSQANFSAIIFSSLPEKIKDIENSLKFSPSILRFLIVLIPDSNKNSRSRKSEHQKNAPKNETRDNFSSEKEKYSEQHDYIGGILSNEALEKKLEEILS